MNIKQNLNIIITILLLMLLAENTRAQTKKPVKKERVVENVAPLGVVPVAISVDSVKLSAQTILPDSIAHPADTTQKKKQLISTPVYKLAKDSIVYSLDGRKAFLYRDAKITYQDKEITANYIEFDADSKVIYATGTPDSTGKNMEGLPKFKDKKDEMDMKELYYNFDSGKAIVKGVITQQGEAYVHGNYVKKMSDNTTFSRNGYLTTCDAEHPHFYIQMTKAKFMPAQKEERDKNGKIIKRGKNGQVVFGPSYLVVEDVPIFPLFLPFGFFPLMSGASSGVIFPSYGEENNRGMFIRGFGYYFLIGDYADLEATADWYTYGSWGLHLNSRYAKRYRFTGSLGFDKQMVKIGEKGAPDYNVSSMYSIKWSHQKASQANPSTTFSASVNYSTSSYNRYADRYSGQQQSINDMLSASAQSSISFSKTWEGTPFSFSSSLSHSQNMRDSTYSFGFPNFTLSMSKIYPFKNSHRVGKAKFYENIGISWNTTFQNNVSNIKEYDLFKDPFWDAMKNSMAHNFSISLPTFTILKYITASPSISYKQDWFFQSTKKEWDAAKDTVVVMESKTFGDFNATHTYSGGVSLTTTVYGLFDKFSPKSKIRAIRHVMTPSISLSYSPNQRIALNGWRKVQINSAGDMEEYNIFDHPANGSRAPSSKASGSINFSLGNTLEMKVRSAKDTSENNEKKIKLLESFNISASYNMLADSMGLSNINFSGRTSVLDGKLGINFSFVVNPYDNDAQGHYIDKFYSPIPIFGRMTNFSASTSYTFSGGKGKGTDNGRNSASNLMNASLNNNDNQNGRMPTASELNDDINLFGPRYVDFSVPWSLSLNLNYSYTNTLSYNSTTQKLRNVKSYNTTLGISGSFNLTENWKISTTANYDISARKLSTSQVSIIRDLHCFDFSFSWIPFGERRSWSFTIRAKSSILSDAIKYDKHSSFYDNYAY